MSTSPSWFDQDKFSRLVKKVGPKTPAGSASGKPSLKPLLKEAQLAPGTKEPEPEPRISLLPPQAQLPVVEKAPEPADPAPTHVTEAQLPLEEVKEIKAPAEVRKAPFNPPSESKRLTSRLTKIDRNTPPPQPKPVPEIKITEEAPPIDPPIHADAGAPVEDEIDKVEEPVAEEKVEETPSEPTPPPLNRPPLASQRMMTSQPLSLGKLADAGAAFPSKTEPKVEPIRAPEPAPSSAIKAPPLPGGVTSSKLPQRTTPLPALKSLFQYEIPGGQGVVPGKPPVLASDPPPLKEPLPTFSFQKPTAKKPTETLPPIADEEEDIPTFSGISDAGHLAEVAEAEEELTAEDLAAEWGKTDAVQADLDRVTKERDDALANSEALEQQLRKLREKPAVAAAPEKPVVDTAEIEFLTRERDDSRSQYMKLREDFEKLKQEQLQAKEEPVAAAPDPELEKKIEKLQNDLSEKDKELRASKLQLREIKDAPKVADPEMQKELEKLRQDVEDKDRELEGKDRDLGLLRTQLHDVPKGPDPEIQKELEKLRQDVGNKDRELEFVKAQLNDIPEPVNAELEKEVEKLRKELEDKNRDLEGKNREIDLVKAQLNDMPEPGNPEAEKEVEKLKGELAEKEREMIALKVAAGQTDVAMDKLKEEIIGVRNEVKKAQNEASVAQRGLALSQKALQETRDALREASEGASKK